MVRQPALKKLQIKDLQFKCDICSVVLIGNVEDEQLKLLDTFLKKCLRKIMRIFWPVKMTNGRVRELAVMGNISTVIKVTPDGRRKQVRPKEAWRRTVEERGNIWDSDHEMTLLWKPDTEQNGEDSSMARFSTWRDGLKSGKSIDFRVIFVIFSLWTYCFLNSNWMEIDRFAC